MISQKIASELGSWPLFGTKETPDYYRRFTCAELVLHHHGDQSDAVWPNVDFVLGFDRVQEYTFRSLFLSRMRQ